MTGTTSSAQRALQVITWGAGVALIALQALAVIITMSAERLSLPGRIRTDLIDRSVPIAGEWISAQLIATPETGERVGMVLLQGAVLALTVAAVISFISLVQLLTRGEAFSSTAVRRLRALAGLSIGLWVATVAHAWITSEIVDVEGVRTGFQIQPTWLVVALVVIVLSQAVEQGRRFRQDTEGLV
jgi:hypothetical protein